MHYPHLVVPQSSPKTARIAAEDDSIASGEDTRPLKRKRDSDKTDSLTRVQENFKSLLESISSVCIPSTALLLIRIKTKIDVNSPTLTPYRVTAHQGGRLAQVQTTIRYNNWR